MRRQLDRKAALITGASGLACLLAAACGGSPDATDGTESDLSTYAWGGKTATRYFCKHCGVHCFARGNLPQLGGDYVSINLNALDEVDPRDVKVVYWDGRHDNWQAGPRDIAWPVVA